MEINITLISMRPTVYALCFMAAFVAAFLFASLACVKSGIPWRTIGLASFTMLFFSLSCGKMYTIIFTEFKNIITAPFSSVGGLIGMLVGLFIFEKLYPEYKSICWQAFGISIPLLYSIAKVGCFLSGCCNGIEYSGPFHIIYHGAIILNGIDYSQNIVKETMLFPVQPVETIVFFIIFCVGTVLFIRDRKREGVICLPITFMLCAVAKGGLELLRMEWKGRISPNQVICLLVFAGSLVYIIMDKKKRLRLTVLKGENI